MPWPWFLNSGFRARRFGSGLRTLPGDWAMTAAFGPEGCLSVVLFVPMTSTMDRDIASGAYTVKRIACLAGRPRSGDVQPPISSAAQRSWTPAGRLDLQRSRPPSGLKRLDNARKTLFFPFLRKLASTSVTLYCWVTRGGGRAHAQEPSPRRRFQDHPAGGRNDVCARGLERGGRGRRRSRPPGS